MVRLYLFAEGQTEQTFADTVLKDHLANFGVYLHGPVLIAMARKKGKIHRGGGRNYVPMKNDIVRFLKQERGTDVYFTTMIDLYAIHSGFPGREESEKYRNDPFQRVQFLQVAFGNDIHDLRFVPFIQLHEFEAILFADPNGFACFYEHAEKQIAHLHEIANSKATPELINDGQHTAPSKRVIAEFPDYEGAKRTVGPQVAGLIGLDTIRSKCPHFNSWITRLEGLGTADPN